MSNKTKKIYNVIFEVIEEINSQLSDELQLKKSEKTVLFGRDGNLDSLGLVNLLVAIEQNIEVVFDVNITIADERAMSQKHNPFGTVGSLADYIMVLLDENINGF